MASHSRTTAVCVAFRHRSTGAVGDLEPKVFRMVDCSAEKDFCVDASVERLRDTVMSTMDPEVMSEGSRIDGNSIYEEL